MVIKGYSVTLEKEVVEAAKDKLVVGQKLSPLINHLLKLWAEGKLNIDEEEILNEK